ncbi:hypothetical protein EYC84_003662 [Monilinia fructicola]|uniref:Uncharacterized protein n=1 Tax=Monilinia fructicola TaxID=38448 RepID=A0A5M9JWX3_MONFR|nr:hypothetical protein EYC84_003662 [Monilinia fructicola]
MMMMFRESLVLGHVIKLLAGLSYYLEEIISTVPDHKDVFSLSSRKISHLHLNGSFAQLHDFSSSCLLRINLYLSLTATLVPN